MRIKVELHRDVVWYIRHQCNRDEALSFYQELEKVRREPITNSEAIAARRLADTCSDSSGSGRTSPSSSTISAGTIFACLNAENLG